MSDSSMMRGALTKQLDRVQLVQAGVWEAPALVFATKWLPAAASEDWRGQVIGINELAVLSRQPGQLDVRIRLEYAFDGWWTPGRPPSGAPLSAILNWRVTAIHEGVASLLGVGAQSVVSSSTTDAVTYAETDFAPGTYTVLLEASANFSNDIGEGAVFIAAPVSAQVTLDVA